MSDVFISYAREDRPRVERLAKALEAAGSSVWWDRKIPLGRSFDSVIEEALNTAKCVLVVWTETSVGSDWVKTEAAEGKARGILVPVLMDDVPIPLAFRRLQTASLVGWEGGRKHEGMEQVLAAVSSLVDPHEPESLEQERQDEAAPNGQGEDLRPRLLAYKWYGIIGLVVLLGVVGVVVLMSYGIEGPRPPGIYLKVDGAPGDSLIIDMVEIVTAEPGSEPVDRPYHFEEHLKGACLVTPVSADSALTWNNVGSCQ